jgi:hypothetical protein
MLSTEGVTGAIFVMLPDGTMVQFPEEEEV